MYTKIITKEVYTYDELPEDVKERVLDKHRYINVDEDYWFDYDGKTGFSAKEIAKYHLDIEHSDDLLTYKTLYFDLDRGSYIQFVDAEFKHDETARKFLGVPKKLWDRTNWTINDCPGREVNTRLEWEFTDNAGYSINPTPKQEEILDRAVERFSDKMDEALKGLQTSWEWSTSREQIEETIRANEYEFTLDGNIA